MALDGQCQLVGRDAAPVVGDLDQGPSRLGDIHRHGLRPGIQGIFHQFFHHRGGAFDHFPRGDLRGDFGRKRRMGILVLYTAYNIPMRFTTFFFDLDDTLYPPHRPVGKFAGASTLTCASGWVSPPSRSRNSRKIFPRIRDNLARSAGQSQGGHGRLPGFRPRCPTQPLPSLRTRNSAPLSRGSGPEVHLHQCRHQPCQACTGCGWVAGAFDGIIDVHAIAPYCKPMPGAFELALKAAGNPDPAPASCSMTRDVSLGRRVPGYVYCIGGERCP